MKGTEVEGTYSRMFQGVMESYIRCKNVDYESKREETFIEIQLNVKGCYNITQSLKKYIEVEELEGDNKYHSEEHGPQDAMKGVVFKSLPPILQI